MKKFAKVINNQISNIGAFPDGVGVPEGWIDTTDIPCDIGWPLDANNNPSAPPSKYHTVMIDNSGWELTQEGMDKQAIDQENEAKSNLIQIDAKSIRSIREFLVLKFSTDPDFPSFLVAHEEEAKAERVKIK